MAVLGRIDVKTVVAGDVAETPIVRRFEPTNEIKRPGLCFVLGCFEPCERGDDGAARVFNHKRFGRVHSCSGHNPTGRDRY